MNKRKPSPQPGRRPTRQAPGNGRGARAEPEVDRDDEPAWGQHSRSSHLPSTVVPDDETEDGEDAADIDIAPHGAERMARQPRRGGGGAGGGGRGGGGRSAARRSAPPAAARLAGDDGSQLIEAPVADGPSPVGVLTCVSGPEEGLGLTLTEGVFGIGRGRDNHFVLKDIAASRQHVEIRVHRGEVMVVDLGSGNGTRINGKRIQQATLKSGDRIEIGNSALTFTPLGGARPARREVSVVPPRPSPKTKDLWPETETLLSELKEFEARAQPRQQQRGVELPASQRHPVQPQMRAYGSSALDDGGGLDDLAGLGQPPRFGSTGWLLAGAGLIVVLLALAALIFYLTQIKSSRADQAQQFVVQGMDAMLKGDLDAARRDFEEAQTRDPKNLDAKKQLEQLGRIDQAEKQFARAQDFFKKGNFGEARHAIEGIPDGTARAKDAEALRQAVDRAEIDDLVARGRAELKAGRIAQAEPLVDKALVLDNAHAGAKGLQQDIEKAKAAAAAAAAPPPEPEKPKEVEKPKEPEKKQPVRQPKKKRTRSVRESRPTPPAEPSGLSDSEARQLYSDGVQAFKDDQLDKAKRIMQKIAKKAPANSEWRQKAESFIERKLQ